MSEDKKLKSKVLKDLRVEQLAKTDGTEKFMLKSYPIIQTVNPQHYRQAYFYSVFRVSHLFAEASRDYIDLTEMEAKRKQKDMELEFQRVIKQGFYEINTSVIEYYNSDGENVYLDECEFGTIADYNNHAKNVDKIVKMVEKEIKETIFLHKNPKVRFWENKKAIGKDVTVIGKNTKKLLKNLRS